MAKNKETSTRGAGKGQRFSSGTEDQLIEDLQRVHKLFPNAQPDKDFYRAHGVYADAAWKEHFSRFEGFDAEAGLLPPGPQILYFMNRAVEAIQRGGKDFSEQEREFLREKIANIQAMFQAMLTARIESQRAVAETLAAMEEKKRLEAEETRLTVKGSGNEQAT
jgi:hypothetical protein